MDRGLLARATASDDGPTPGYLYGEIAKMTRASFDVCSKVEDYLAKRCANKNANVKLKALVVIRHVAEKGAPQFRQQMVRRLPVIKDCQQFSGPPDPLRGDEPYRRVRQAAKDAIEALTSDDYERPAQSMQGFSGGHEAYDAGPQNYPPQQSGRMEGFGNAVPEREPAAYMAKAQRMASRVAEKAATHLQSQNHLQRSDSGYWGGDQRRSAEFGSHRAMPGVGNPRFGDARNAPPTWQERVQDGARSAAQKVEKLRFGTTHTESFDPSFQYASNRGANAYGGGNHAAPSSTQEWGDRRRGGVGGGWGGTASAPPPASSYAPSAPASSSRTEPATAGRAGGAETDGEYERRLVQDLCGAGGTRAVPPPDKLSAFVDAAATLDADAVGPALLEELDDARPWQARAKACAVVEALCRADGCEHHLGYFSEVADDLVALASAPNLALRKQARRMLAALDVDGGAPAAVPRRAAPASAEADLLGGFAEPAAATAPTAAPSSVAATAPAAAPSLLDEVGFGGAASPVAPPAPPPAAPPVAPPAPAGLFGNLSVKESSPPPPQEAPSLLDAFSASLGDAATSASNAFPQTAAAAADIFGGGELQPTPPPPPPAETPTSPVSPGGDPFAALTGLPLTREDRHHANTAGRTGPAFVAPQSQQQWQHQQWQQQQWQQQQAWRQQQWQQQQHMAGGPPSFTAAPPMMPGRAPAIPPADPAQQSGFAFMGGGEATDDSFGFVSDLIGAKK